MDKRFWISAIVVFVVSFVLGWLVHGTLLQPEYAKLTNLFRPMAEHYLGLIALANALFALAFTWIYRKGLEPGKPFLGQGLRYGIAIALLMTIPTYLTYYAVQPMPGSLVAKQIVYDVIAVVILGVVVAWTSQPARAA